MHIVSGPARVVENGMATAFMGGGLRIELDGMSVVSFQFETTPDDPSARAETEWTDEGIRFVLFNFDDPAGRGSKEPVLLGEMGEDLLFLHFRVFRWGSSPDRTLHYTFYAVPKSEVWWQEGVGKQADGADEGSQG